MRGTLRVVEAGRTTNRLGELFGSGPLMTRALTVVDYLALGETEQRTELVEGQLVLSAGPSVRHQCALLELTVALDAQLPEHLDAIYRIDLDLQLAPPEGPGWVRCPDLVVAPRKAWDRVDRDGGVLSASDVTLLVELTSPGTRRTDHVTKRGEYADAGIPHYWIVDLDGPVSMTLLHLAGGFGYADGGVVTGTFSATTPFPVEIDLDALV